MENIYHLLNIIVINYCFKMKNLCYLAIAWAIHFHIITVFVYSLFFIVFRSYYFDSISLDLSMTDFLIEIARFFY